MIEFIGNNGFVITLAVITLLLFSSALIGPIDFESKKKGK